MNNDWWWNYPVLPVLALLLGMIVLFIAYFFEQHYLACAALLFGIVMLLSDIFEKED